MIARRPLGFLNPADGRQPRFSLLQGCCPMGEQRWSRQGQPRAPCCLPLPAWVWDPAQGWHRSPPRSGNRHVWCKGPREGGQARWLPRASSVCGSGWGSASGHDVAVLCLWLDTENGFFPLFRIKLAGSKPLAKSALLQLLL